METDSWKQERVTWNNSKRGQIALRGQIAEGGKLVGGGRELWYIIYVIQENVTICTGFRIRWAPKRAILLKPVWWLIARSNCTSVKSSPWLAKVTARNTIRFKVCGLFFPCVARSPDWMTVVRILTLCVDWSTQTKFSYSRDRMDRRWSRYHYLHDDHDDQSCFNSYLGNLMCPYCLWYWHVSPSGV